MRYTIPLIAAMLLAACTSQPPAPEQPPATEGSANTKNVGGDAVDMYGIGGLTDPRSPLSKRSIYFDYDQYVVKDEFRSTIEAHAKFLMNNPQAKVLIQGNADERGSREYNLALGQKRAAAVKKSLSLFGAREDQIEAVSLGKEKPVCAESTEDCWAKNRRADILHSAAKEF
jgi:peptidoglycan-associated lipoprotein